MTDKESRVVSFLAKEGLGIFANEFETHFSDLESTRLSKLLSLVVRETERLPDSLGQSDEPILAARECHRLAQEIIESLTDNDEINYRRLLIIGYLYGRLTQPSRQAQKELYEHWKRDQQRLSGTKLAEIEREKGREWMREKADEIWKSRSAEKLRIGKVAAIVKDLAEEEIAARRAQGDESVKYWPKSLERIKKAIKPAPEYASKGGRPTKK